MIDHDWHGLYAEGWQGEIVPEAFAHPAKFSRGLIRRIYEYCLEQDWLKPGDVVLDPFGGVGLGGDDAALFGLTWIGIELEDRFVKLGQENIALWLAKYGPGNAVLDNLRARGKLPQYGSVTLIQGDSRNLSEILSIGAAGAVSSPPFLQQSGGTNVTAQTGPLADKRLLDRHAAGNRAAEGYGESGANLGNMPEGKLDAAIGSPPFGDAQTGGELNWEHQEEKYHRRFTDKSKNIGYRKDKHGEDPKNLANLKEGSLDAAISSPPFGESLASDDPDKRGGLYRDPKRRKDKTLTAEYGTSEGQLGKMKDDGFDGVVTSPPFQDQVPQQDKNFQAPHDSTGNLKASYGSSPGQLGSMRVVSSPPWEASTNTMSTEDAQKYNNWAKNPDGSNRLARSLIGGGYGSTDGNLGNSQSDTFWSAARQIVEQTYSVLKPGAVAVWVLKAFVRKGEYVDFPQQWRQLCESVGFETLEWIRAWLIEERGTQYGLFGEQQGQVIERKSFFRRLAESHARAVKFWKQINRAERAKYLWQSHGDLWQIYHEELEDPITGPDKPTKSKIISNAQVLAWTDAGKPRLEIETSIDFEIVLIQRKPDGAEGISIE